MSQTHIPAAKEQIVDLLRPVIEPETGQGIVDLGLVRDVVQEDGKTVIGVELLAPLSPHREKVEQQIRAALVPAPDLGSTGRFGCVPVAPVGRTRNRSKE